MKEGRLKWKAASKGFKIGYADGDRHEFTLNSPNKSTSTLPRSGMSYWPSYCFWG
ncbi:hypothetical protein F2Q68_00033535 [Brassica cretica]|uniref:Uncharacterized protein n=1 Tax=Brassica cretica TaxID=69181 RepID=A0A8S9H2E6_BRACR|nr:hypothetical protein F2Q68_00033535 [Brassica cretica]